MKPRNASEWGTAIAAFAAFVGACVDFAVGSWPTGIVLIALGLVQALGILAKRAAYYCGWMEGRSNLILSMGEAQRRGMRPGDFMVSVMEKDTAMTVEQMGKRRYRKFRERVEAGTL